VGSNFYKSGLRLDFEEIRFGKIFWKGGDIMSPSEKLDRAGVALDYQSLIPAAK